MNEQTADSIDAFQPGAKFVGGAWPEPVASPWAQVKALYERLAPLPPAERAASLAAADIDDDLRADVRSLLDHAPDRTENVAFLATPAAAGLLREEAADRSGQALGRWQIVRPLGSGGMGDVFEARRADGAYEGRAAVKVLKRGMDTHAVLQRFAQERRALARLQHPHIATLLDAGVSPDGLPYVVMEFVEGVPIDEAVRRLPLESRLALFLQLADAVAHAHRNLLVHRDLKPGNVLVTADGQVKLLDFGIVKALDAGAAHAGATVVDLTLAAACPYTPHHASPEQVRGESISTATDIYSLGALLYQMLTGVRPTGRQATTPAEAARGVLEETPVRPSAAPVEPAADEQALDLRRSLAGDLDNIVLKALEKPIDRRYSSVEAMAADLRLYQRGYPVSARAPSRRYLLGKLVSRHRGVAAALALAVASMVLGLGFSLWQTHRADLARDNAERQLAGIKQVTSELVFRFGDAINAMPGGGAAQEALLTQTIASLDHALRQSPDDADLRALTAAALGRLAQLQGNPALATADRSADAEATVARALALADPIWEAKRREWQFAQWHVITLITQAHLLRDRGRLADTLPVLARAVERAGQSLASPLPDTGRAYLLEARSVALQTAATIYQSSIRPSLHRPADALRFYDAAQADVDSLRNTPGLLAAMDRDAVPGEPAALEYNIDANAAVQLGRAMCRYQLDDLEGARRDAEQALAMAAHNLQADPTDVLWRNRSLQIEDMLATVLIRLGEPVAALRAADAATALAKSLVQSNSGQSKSVAQLAAVGAQRARALAALGRDAEALPLYDAAARSLAAAKPSTEPAVADEAQLQAERLAIDRAASLIRLQRRAVADAALDEARTVLDRLAAHPASRREALLLRARADVLRHRETSTDAGGWNMRARADLLEAARLQPLAADSSALLASVQ